MSRARAKIEECRLKVAEIKAEVDALDVDQSSTQLRSKVDDLSSILESMPQRDLYDELEPFARNVKIIGQMVIGTVVVGIVLIRTAVSILQHAHFLGVDDTLLTVSGGLAVAATLELAYTFFTSGPDEAVEPLILGLSAATLLVITSLRQPTWAATGLIVSLVIALVLLFVVRDFFITHRHESRILVSRDGSD